MVKSARKKKVVLVEVKKARAVLTVNGAEKGRMTGRKRGRSAVFPYGAAEIKWPDGELTWVALDRLEETSDPLIYRIKEDV